MKTSSERTPNNTHESNDSIKRYLLPRAAMVAAGLLTAGIYGASHDKASTEPEAERYSVTYSAVAEISEGGTPTEAAEKAAEGMNESSGPSDVQLGKLQAGAMDSAETLRLGGHTVQRGDSVHIKIGELDGKPDENGEHGTDVAVTINPRG